jgi:hypothetical protein
MEGRPKSKMEEVVPLVERATQPESTVVQFVDARALCPEATCDQGSDAGFILNQQDPHQPVADPTKWFINFRLRWC